MTNNKTMSRPLAATWRGIGHPLHWGAVFAGLAVGMAVHLVLLLIGATAALPVFDPTHPSITPSVALVVGVWDVASMALSTLVGGYVAARASGLRRTGDGVIHGAVLWGTATMFLATLAVSASGRDFGGLFIILARLDAADARSTVWTAWLAATIMLALLAAVVGGAAGVRAGRRFEHRSLRTLGAATAPEGAVAKAG